MEVCVDSLASAINAEKGGANRIELCASLAEGGLTPSLGFLSAVKQYLQIPVFVLIRARGGDFCYSVAEIDLMKKDIEYAKANGADGFVIGALKTSGELDLESCNTLLMAAKPLPVTLHRAFDLAKNADQAMEDAISLGFDRILTSGQASDALEGLRLISLLREKAGGRIVIMPGGGITEQNLAEILLTSKVTEFHSSASVYVSSTMNIYNSSVSMGDKSSDFQWKVSSAEKVSKLLSIARRIWLSNENC